MILQGTAIANLIIEVSGIMICIFALITVWTGSIKYSAIKRYMTEAFSCMLAYNLCLLLLEFTQASQGSTHRGVVLLTGFGTYLFPLITAYIVSLFVATTVCGTEELCRRMYIFLSILMGLESVALVYLQLTGRLVLVDAAGRFSYGSASGMGYLVTTVFMVIDLFMVLKMGQNITPSQRIAFIVYLSLPILGLLIRGFIPGVYVVALSSCLSMIIMLVVITNEQSKSFRQQELDNEHLKVDLMLSQIQPHFLFNVLYVI